MSVVKDFIEDWGRVKSPRTIDSFRSLLEDFNEFCSLEEATKSDIYDYLDTKLENDEIIKSTANEYIGKFKRFYKWLEDEQTVPVGQKELQQYHEDMNRIRKIIKMDRYRAPSRSEDPFTKRELIELLNIANDTDKYHFLVLGYFGLRRSAYQNLKKRDINLSNRSLHIRAEETKTYKERTLYFDGEIASILREMMNKSPNQWLLGRKPCKSYLNKRIERNEYSERLGTNVHPHRLRHTFNQHMKQILDDNLLLKRLMGHKVESTDMTARYSKPVEDIVRDAMTNKHYYKRFGIMDKVI